MDPHDLPFFIGQLAWFVKNIIVDADLADVVEVKPRSAARLLAFNQFHLPAGVKRLTRKL
jgi:hypothetical protein